MSDTVAPAPEGEGAPPAPPPRRRRRLLRYVLVIGAVVTALLLALAGVSSYFLYRYDHNVARIPNVFAPAPGEKRPARIVANAENLLLVGSDSRAAGPTTGTGGNPAAPSPIGERSDTIMLVHLSADGSSGYLVSIPRDSWVPIPGYGDDKINAALAFGGPRLLRQTVEQLTNVRIDHYLQVDFSGFKAMTDAVGGVDIDVPVDSFDSSNRTQWHAGVQHLDGAEALLYVRQRYGLPRGDFDRIEHQHQFLQALLGRATRAGMLTNPIAVNRLMQSATKSISVDSGLSGRALLSLGRRLENSRGDLRYATVPVTGTGYVGQASVVFLDAGRGERLWSAVRSDTVKKYLSTSAESGR